MKIRFSIVRGTVIIFSINDSPFFNVMVKEEEVKESGGWPLWRRSENKIREALVHIHTMVGAGL